MEPETRSVESDLEFLLEKYDFEELDYEKYPRSKEMDECPYQPHPNGVRPEDCVCDEDTGIYTARAHWVNADHAYTTQIDGKTILLMEFGDWFSITIYAGEIKQNDLLEVTTPKVGWACTTHWEGGMAGSGIRRFPNYLRGFMYRCDLGGDHHVLPPDIITYLLTGKPVTLRSYTVCVTETIEKRTYVNLEVPDFADECYAAAQVKNRAVPWDWDNVKLDVKTRFRGRHSLHLAIQTISIRIHQITKVQT